MITQGTMTTLLPDLAAASSAAARTTRLVVEAAAGRPRVRTETIGDQALPGLRPMLVGSGPGQALVSLVPDGALLLAGDAVRFEVEVGTGVRLDLVEPAGTVAYDMRGGSAQWDVHLDLAADATLVWAGEPFVLAAGARVRRCTEARLGPGARLAIRETLVLGRHAEQSGELVQTWYAADEEGELLVEELHLDEAAHRPGVLGGHRVLGSATALGVPLEDRPDVCRDGRLDLERGGTVWRRLADEAHRAVPAAAWRAVLDAC
jgi:urease accessory protein